MTQDELKSIEAAILDLYEKGPNRGNAVWGQAWGIGVLDAADVVRRLCFILPPPSHPSPELPRPADPSSSLPTAETPSIP